MQKVPDDHPLMIAWEEYKASGRFENSKQWLLRDAVKHVDGSLWAAFDEGWKAATERMQSMIRGAMVDFHVDRQSRRVAIPSALFEHIRDHCEVDETPHERIVKHLHDSVRASRL